MASDPSQVPRLLAPFGSARQADSAVFGTRPGPAAARLACETPRAERLSSRRAALREGPAKEGSHGARQPLRASA